MEFHGKLMTPKEMSVRIKANIKPILKKYGIKAKLSVGHRRISGRRAILTLLSGKIDFKKDFIVKNDVMGDERAEKFWNYPYYYNDSLRLMHANWRSVENNFEGISREFLLLITDALLNNTDRTYTIGIAFGGLLDEEYKLINE